MGSLNGFFAFLLRANRTAKSEPKLRIAGWSKKMVIIAVKVQTIRELQKVSSQRKFTALGN
jgi:hypothetical protein